MKISDEIRRWCKAGYDIDELRALADRIGAEMVELPRDEGGVPIHIGDTVYDLNGDRKMVRSLRLYNEEKHAWMIVEDRWGVEMLPGELTHERPDSLERIADELDDWSEDNRVNGNHETFSRARDFADRIRKLAKEEGQR